jgi:23S rRNA pseudouridine2605 synthase
VNGRIVRELATLVDPRDRVEVNGKRVAPPAEPTYLLLHKPLRVVTTMRDPEGRRTIADIVGDRSGIFPVGRLDYDTSGALLLTDDGELAHRLLHPSFGVEKTYRAAIDGRLSPQDVQSLTRGVALAEFRAAAAKVRVVAVRRDHSVVDVTVREGRNRQVRRMFEALGHRVIALARTRFGPLRLGPLPVGQHRPLTSRERAALEPYRGRGNRTARMRNNLLKAEPSTSRYP